MPRLRLITLALFVAFGSGAITGCAPIERTGTVVRKVFVPLTEKPSELVRMMENERSADERRRGINKLVERGFARKDPYTKRYAEIAQDDADYLVRATAIRALNRSRYRPATPVFVGALKDTSPLVRLEAAKALANMPDVDATAPLVKAVNDPGEDRDVRIASADALKHYKNADVVRALVAVLPGREFGVAWQARHSLRRITGKDLRYDDAAWQAYLNGPNKPFG